MILRTENQKKSVETQSPSIEIELLKSLEFISKSPSGFSKQTSKNDEFSTALSFIRFEIIKTTEYRRHSLSLFVKQLKMQLIVDNESLR